MPAQFPTRSSSPHAALFRRHDNQPCCARGCTKVSKPWHSRRHGRAHESCSVANEPAGTSPSPESARGCAHTKFVRAAPQQQAPRPRPSLVMVAQHATKSGVAVRESLACSLYPAAQRHCATEGACVPWNRRQRTFLLLGSRCCRDGAEMCRIHRPLSLGAT